jgi:hypothetical protein
VLAKSPSTSFPIALWGSWNDGGGGETHLECLGRQSHRPLNTQILALCALEQFRADFLEGLDFATRQGDADFVDFLEVKMVSALFFFFACRACCGEEGRVKCVLGPRHRRIPSLAFGMTCLSVRWGMWDKWLESVVESGRGASHDVNNQCSEGDERLDRRERVVVVRCAIETKCARERPRFRQG